MIKSQNRIFIHENQVLGETWKSRYCKHKCSKYIFSYYNDKQRQENFQNIERKTFHTQENYD